MNMFETYWSLLYTHFFNKEQQKNPLKNRSGSLSHVVGVNSRFNMAEYCLS